MARSVVIAAFKSVAEAHQAQMALEASGIGANVIPRNDALERRCADVFDDGFDVVVGEGDADAAIALVQTMWLDAPIDIAPAETCPACGSTAVGTIPRLLIFVIAAIVLYATGLVVHQSELFSLVVAIIALVILIAPNRRCRECGERWTRRRA